jgi:putative copper export protein
MLAPLAWMLIGHALADYPLQGDWLSKAKNQTLSLVPGEVIWPGALACHAAIHAGAVMLATGSWLLAGLEFVAHALIDLTKCSGRLSYNMDQAMHVLCKLVWFGLLMMGID